MLGIVFTEFLEMVEERFGEDIVDDIIEESAPISDGAYTSVGRYSHKELVDLLVSLSKKLDTPTDDLVIEFGKYLLARFSVLFPDFFANINDPFEFLETVDEYIHIEVHKLYPDAVLPRITTLRQGDRIMQLEYKSTRPFSSLARGLIAGVFEYYQCKSSIDKKDFSVPGKSHVIFTLTRL